MNCYKALDPSSQRHILSSLLGTAVLLTHTFYSAGVIATGSSRFPIPFIVLDSLFTIGLLCRIWYIVYSNDAKCTTDGGFFAGVLIAIYFIACYGFVLGYMLSVFATHIIPFLPQELIIVIPFLIILAALFCCLMWIFVGWFCTTVSVTFTIVKSRSTEIKINDSDVGCESVTVSQEGSETVEYEPVPLYS